MADREYHDTLDAITYFISTEAAQVVAFILSRLPSALGADVFKTLSGSVQPEVAFHIARIDRPETRPLNTRIARDLASRIPTDLQWIPTQKPEIGGPEILNRLLNHLGPDAKEAIRKRLDEMDPDLAVQIRDHTPAVSPPESSEPRRRTAKPAGYRTPLVLGGALVAIALIAFGVLKQIPGQGRKAAVTQVKGQAFLIAGNTKRPAQDGALEPGERIETGAESNAILNLPEEAGKLRVEAETSVEVDNPDPESDTPPQLNLRLGNIVIQAQQPDLIVRSPLVEATGSEGSVYRLRVVLDGTTTLSVLRGTVQVKPLIEADQDHLTLNAGQEVQVDPSGRIRVSR